MKPFARNSMCVLLLLVLALLLLPGRAAADTVFEAEETVFLDCGVDQRSYGRQVAELKLRRLDVRGNEIQSPVSGEKTLPLTAVLVRSNGQAVDFTDWAPRYVVAGPYNCYTLFFANAAEAGIAARELAARDTIRYAELDGSVQACGAEDYSFQSWGATAMNFGAYLDYQTQWRSGEATVAIIDSGVYYQHPMLNSRIRESGHDYIDNDEDSTNDLFGHGTNVAGVVVDCTAGAAGAVFKIHHLVALRAEEGAAARLRRRGRRHGVVLVVVVLGGKNARAAGFGLFLARSLARAGRGLFLHRLKERLVVHPGLVVILVHIAVGVGQLSKTVKERHV